MSTQKRASSEFIRHYRALVRLADAAQCAVEEVSQAFKAAGKKDPGPLRHLLATIKKNLKDSQQLTR